MSLAIEFQRKDDDGNLVYGLSGQFKGLTGPDGDATNNYVVISEFGWTYFDVHSLSRYAGAVYLPRDIESQLRGLLPLEGKLQRL